MHLRRSFRAATAAVAGSLAVVGAVVVGAPAAHATELTWTSKCVNQIVPTLPIPPSETKVDVTVSPVKDVYSVGDLVTVNWKWLSYSTVPNAGLPAIPKDSTKPIGNVALSGAQTGTVQIEGPRVNPESPVGTPFVISDMTGTFTLTAAGTVSLTPQNYRVFTQVGAINAETDCDPQGAAPGTAATLTVQDGQSSGPSLTAPSGDVLTGATISLSGSNFAPHATPQLSLCDADGNSCASNGFTANTLSIDAAGALTGTATVSPGVADGVHVVRVVDGTGAATAPITVKNFVPTGPRTAVGNVTSGPVGTVVHVTGENWEANADISVLALDPDDFWLSPFITVTSTPDGKFSADFPIGNEWVHKIQVMQGGNEDTAVRFPFTITGSAVSQNASVTLAPGALAMTQAGDGLDFGTVTLNGEAQTVKANLNQVTVTDARGGTLGWSLTGSMTDLVAANGTDKIPAGNLAWTPSCAATEGSLSAVANGTAGPLSSSAATLCGVTADGTTSGGKFTADAEVSLTTPKFGAAGSYTGTLTLTLI